MAHEDSFDYLSLLSLDIASLPSAPNFHVVVEGVIDWDVPRELPDPPEEAQCRVTEEIRERNATLSALLHHETCLYYSQRMSQERDSPRHPINDATCIHFDDNPYLRCAVNPTGQCEGCQYWVGSL